MNAFPKRRKYRKAFKGRVKVSITRKASQLHFGDYGIIGLEPGRITGAQIEAARRAIVRKVKRSGKVWIRIFADIPVTKKPAEVRMGKGKGSVDHWVCRVMRGRVLFEMSGIPFDLAKQALRLGQSKLPIKTKFISKIERSELLS